MKKEKIYKIRNANWNLFQQKLDSQINIIDFEGKNLEQIETELTNWTNIVKNQ